MLRLWSWLWASLLSVVNTKLFDDEWTVRTNKSQVLYIRPVANLHYSIVPYRSAPLVAAPELATAYPLRDIAIYEQYVLQMTGSNFLPISKIKINLSFKNDRLLSKIKLTIQYIWLITILHILNPLGFGPHRPNPSSDLDLTVQIPPRARPGPNGCRPQRNN